MTLLALDWGTSSLRGALLAADGTVIEERSFARGILTVEKGGFPALFDSLFGDWMQPDTLCLIAGMAGSQQGWLEAPYCPCPAGFAEIAAGLAWVDQNRIAIVPGLSIEKQGTPDVMRGEETQLFGALQRLGLHDACMVLPGTHSKWVTVTDRRVTDFSTWMTGEFYALLREHSILARTMPAFSSTNNAAQTPALEPDAFEQGVAHALRGDGLLHTAFSTRTLSLFKRLPEEALPSYLSGLVIGEELKCQTLLPGQTVVIIGSETLAVRYALALRLMGVPVQRADGSAAWYGLRAIANTLNHPKTHLNRL